MGFKDEVNELKNIVLTLQKNEEKEIISDKDAARCLILLNYINYEKVPDAFLG